MRLKLLLFLGLVCVTQARESRNLLKWLFGGESNEQPSQKSDQVLRIGENVRTLPSQSLLRRTNQLDGARDSIQTRGLARGRVLNRPAPGGPVRGYKRPPGPSARRPLDRVPPAPVIYSSYASSVVQGRGQEEQKRIQETFDKYERLNEISDEDVDSEKKEELEALSEEEDVESEERIVEEDVENEERVVEATVELIRNTEAEDVITERVPEKNFEETESSQATSTTTEQTSRAPAKKAAEKVGLTESPAINEIVEFEIVDDENPYLPAIPENLDGDIHGAHDHLEDEEKNVDEKVEEAEKKIFQAGYKEILPVKVPAGDRYEQRVTRVTTKPQASINQNVYPLGKPQRPPLKPSRPAQRPGQTGEQGSLFDFLPSGLSSLWSSPTRPPLRPRRPIGPPPPPGPGPRPAQETGTDYHRGLLKVDTDPNTDPASPVRPEVQETPGISSRIDNSLVTEIKQEPEAFVVLPSKQRTPLEKKTSSSKIIPKRPRLPPPPPQRLARPPPPRPLKARLPGQGPLPMLSQPVIGLPQVPAGRKQAPFLPKRPLLPPQLPKTFPGAPSQVPKQGPKLPSGPLQKPQVPPVVLKKPLGPPPQKTEQKSEAQTFLKKPLENFPKKSFVKPKPVSLSPVIARLTQQTKVQDKKPFDFRPNGSSQQPSPFISNISSMLNRFLGTTPGPAPAPSLPSLVEETEFADIVTGYKPSDKNETESRGEKEITTTTTPNDKTTTMKPLIKVDEYDDIDSLTAPVPAKPTKLQKPQFPNPNWKKETFKKRPSPPVVRTSPPVPTTTTTTTPTTTTTARPTPVTTITTAYPAPIQALVQEYQEKGHVIEQPTYPKPVLQAIQRDFQQKEKIFQQFVTFDETDKAFIPNKEAVNSDWNLDLNINTPAPPPSLSDKILVYQTLSPPGSPVSTPAPVSRLASLQEGARRSSAQSFPHERNAEGGFQPMLRPLHQPLLTQHLAA